MPNSHRFPLILRALILLTPFLSGSLDVRATELSLTVRDANGAPVADAVVTVQSSNGPAKTAPIPANTYRINQHDTAFDPFVTVIPSGAAVAFVNSDPWGHHVYSFSSIKRFKTTVESEAETKPVLFDKPGIVVIGCNIHDRMLAYIHVSGEGVSAKSNKAGVVRFPGLANGDYRLSVWHPFLRSKRKRPTLDVSVNNTDAVEREIVLALKRPKKKKKKRY